VRLLVDANLSPVVAARLRSAEFEAVHVADVGLLTAADEAIMEYAAASGLVIVSADTDFGEHAVQEGRRTASPAAVRRACGKTSRRLAGPPDLLAVLFTALMPQRAAVLLVSSPVPRPAPPNQALLPAMCSTSLVAALPGCTRTGACSPEAGGRARDSAITMQPAKAATRESLLFQVTAVQVMTAPPPRGWAHIT
jgi:predicted nuclease of predicted toxin-antitoxin system